MGLIDAALSPLRAVLGVAEREAEHVLPVRDIEEIQERVLDGVDAIRKATESVESHVAVLETLATSLPPLTDAVTQLTVQLGELLAVIAPIAAAEREVAKVHQEIEKVEGELGRVGHLFGRRRPGAGGPEETSSGPGNPRG